jgi:hypothetical protein
MKKLNLLAILVLTVSIALPVPAALGQQEGVSPETGGEPCKAGELCGNTDVEEPFGGSSRNANDPPGHYVRSLLTLGFIAVFIGSYLFIALTGRSPFRHRLHGNRRGA